MALNVLQLIVNMNLQIQEAQDIPSRKKKIHSRHMVTKLKNNKYKEKVDKAASKKGWIT